MIIIYLTKGSPGHFHPRLYIVIMILLIIFPMMSFVSDDYFVASNLYFLIPSRLSLSSPTPFLFGNHQSVLCISEAIHLKLFILELFFYSLELVRLHCFKLIFLCCSYKSWRISSQKKATNMNSYSLLLQLSKNKFSFHLCIFGYFFF